MYKYVKKFTKNDNIGVMSAGLYMMMPYHLTDMYIRNALGEFLSFIFIPIVFLGLYETLTEKKFSINLVLGASLLLLTHNIATLCTAFFSLIYALSNFKSLKEKVIWKNLILSLTLILLITGFYTIPLIEHKVATEYHVFVEDGMGSMENLMNKRIEIKQLFRSEHSKVFVFEIGVLTIITLLVGVFAFKKIDKEILKDYIVFFILGIFCAIASTNIFPWDKLPNQIKVIQFSWRLLEFSSFFFSIIGAINIVLVIKKFNFLDVISIFLIGIFFLQIVSASYIQFEEKELVFDEYGAGIIKSNITQKGQGVVGIAKAEYLPEKAYRNMDYIINRENGIIVLDGEAEFFDETKKGTKLTAKIKSKTEKIVIELPYIYYLGYDVKINGNSINTFETDNGFIGIEINENGQGSIEVCYTGTILMKISLCISFITILGLIIYSYKRKME